METNEVNTQLDLILINTCRPNDPSALERNSVIVVYRSALKNPLKAVCRTDNSKVSFQSLICNLSRNLWRTSAGTGDLCWLLFRLWLLKLSDNRLWLLKFNPNILFCWNLLAPSPNTEEKSAVLCVSNPISIINARKNCCSPAWSIRYW